MGMSSLLFQDCIDYCKLKGVDEKYWLPFIEQIGVIDSGYLSCYHEKQRNRSETDVGTKKNKQGPVSRFINKFSGKDNDHP
jgi:hypothetical protein